MWSYARADTINQRLLKRLKRVGMNWISYGFETGSPEMLKDIEKGYDADKVHAVIQMTQGEGVHICADVIFGLWGDTAETLTQTYDFLVRYNFEWVNMYPMFAYPGTAIYKDFKKPESWKTYALYGYECVPAGTKYLTPREVLRFRDEAFFRYYTRGEYLRMVEDKFGTLDKKHVLQMAGIPLRRRLLEGE